MAKTQKKKIVAIMFTSLVDYQKLSKKDSKLALEILGEHDKILLNSIKKSDGSIIKHINESIFAEFPSATDASNAAINIQKSLKEANDINPKDFQIEVGIGIHMAEVYEEDGDLFGDGINLAARIKSVAYKSEILTTQAIYNSIRSEKDMYVRDIGRVVLKNIQDPERIFKVYHNKSHFDSETLDSIIHDMQERGISFFDYKANQNQSIKICMHYINNLGAEDDEFLCFGVTDSINIELNKIDNIVTPKTADILKFKSLDNPSDIGKKLDVDYALQGSLMKMGDQFRLSLIMTNIVNSKEVWSEHWEDSTNNLPNIKNEILIKILESLGLEIPHELSQKYQKKQEVNVQAYELLMKGKYAFLNAKNATDLDISAALFKQAFEEQPSYITARNYYANILFRLKKYEDAINSLEEAENIGKKNKDELGLCQIYNTFGIIYKQMGKYNQAINYLKEGLRLATNLEKLRKEAQILNTLGQCYTNMTNPEKAIDYLKRSIKIKRQLDRPIEIANSLGNLALAYRRIGDYAKSISLWEESIELTKTNNIHVQLGRSIMNYANLLYYIGRTDQAHEKYLESLELCKQFNNFADVGIIYRHLGLIELNNNNPEKAIKYLLKANKTHQDTRHQIAIDTTTLFLAQAYLQNNDLDNASKYVEQAVILTNRRRHSDKTQSFDEYYTLPSRCVQALINTKLEANNKNELDDLLDEIINLHDEKHKGRELWWLAQAYHLIKDSKNSKKCQKLAQDELYRKADRIRDKQIRKDYLKLPPLHQQIFMNIEDAVSQSDESIEDDDKQKDNSKNSNIYKFCPSCGFNNENSFKFCPGCGVSLISS